MTTSFPTSLDAFPNPTGTMHLDQPGLKHSDQHININDTVEAVETKLGVDLSNVTNTIDYIAKLFLLTQTQHFDGGYREIEYSSTIPVLPVHIKWYMDSSKTITLVSKEYTYGGQIKVAPTIIALKLYDGTLSNIVLRTVTDNLTYIKIFETARERTVS